MIRWTEYIEELHDDYIMIRWTEYIAELHGKSKPNTNNLDLVTGH